MRPLFTCLFAARTRRLASSVLGAIGFENAIRSRPAVACLAVVLAVFQAQQALGISSTTLDHPQSGSDYFQATDLLAISGNTIGGRYRTSQESHGFAYDGASFFDFPPITSEVTDFVPTGVSGGKTVGYATGKQWQINIYSYIYDG